MNDAERKLSERKRKKKKQKAKEALDSMEMRLCIPDGEVCIAHFEWLCVLRIPLHRDMRKKEQSN